MFYKRHLSHRICERSHGQESRFRATKLRATRKAHEACYKRTISYDEGDQHTFSYHAIDDSRFYSNKVRGRHKSIHTTIRTNNPIFVNDFQSGTLNLATLENKLN